jgi:cytochrome c-type biogenesis protein NrfE
MRRLRLLSWAITGGVWLLLLRLSVAFVRSEMSWRYVAEHSRRDAPWYYRLAGVWGGSQGSLLLFVAITALVASIAARQCRSLRAVLFGLGTTTVLLVVNLWLASPFGRLSLPAVRGFGLTPILEHPAMAVHPPLLYVGLAATLAVAMAALDGRSAFGWLRVSLALITAAMALGGLWSYVEQGWGGYWAWDPVENTSLLVWLAVLIALHRLRAPRLLLDATPWIVALASAALVRSGSTPSIHGFAEQASIGWSLLAITAVSAITVVVARLRTDDDTSGEEVPSWRTGSARDATLINNVLAAAAFVVVAAGTLAPVAIDLFGDRPAAVRGVFFSRVVGPLALVALPFIAARLRHPRGRLAHIGMLVLLVGIGASTFDREATIGIADGQVVDVAGLGVTGQGVRVIQGSRSDTQAVVADVVVDGHLLHPSLTAYPDRGGVLAETAMVTRPWRDIQVTLADATDDGLALIVVRQRPLVWMIWLGALLTTIGAFSPKVRRSARCPAAAAACEPTTR